MNLGFSDGGLFMEGKEAELNAVEDDELELESGIFFFGYTDMPMDILGRFHFRYLGEEGVAVRAGPGRNIIFPLNYRLRVGTHGSITVDP